MGHRPYNGELVHHRGLERQVLRDADAGNPSGNLLELASNFRWRIRFQIVHVQVAGATTHKDLNHCSIFDYWPGRTRTGLE